MRRGPHIERLVAGLHHVLALRNATTIDRGYPESYRDGGLERLIGEIS